MECEGWLTKLGFKSGKWQRRYFVLKHCKISYASGITSSEKGHIMLNADSTCCAIPPGFSLLSLSDAALKGHATPKAPVGAFAFQVVAGWKVAGARAFILMAESEEQRDTWVSKIMAAIDSFKPTVRLTLLRHGHGH